MSPSVVPIAARTPLRSIYAAWSVFEERNRPTCRGTGPGRGRSSLAQLGWSASPALRRVWDAGQDGPRHLIDIFDTELGVAAALSHIGNLR